ncbi:MAG: prepilin-type N-terminal cleavage/methylation domain-containing protein [Alphaproteobacteria bacterium]|nr:prepilin-type N-terminal cleavage/methylation domain-containing protein [Alphaproteobacteria bacterium]
MPLRHRMPYRYSQAGFTLIELLVAITVLGLLMALLFANIQTATKSWLSTKARFSDADDIRHIQTFLRMQLSQAYPKFISGDATTSHIDFDGQEEALVFLAPMPEASGGAGLAYIKIAAQRDAENLKLIMTIRPELAWDEISSSAPIILASGLKSIRFSFYGGTAQQAPEWTGQWAGKPELPKLVRLSLQFDEEAKTSWPDFVAAPKIAVDAGCVYDPLTNFCQGR